MWNCHWLLLAQDRKWCDVLVLVSGENDLQRLVCLVNFPFKKETLRAGFTRAPLFCWGLVVARAQEKERGVIGNRDIRCAEMKSI